MRKYNSLKIMLNFLLFWIFLTGFMMCRNQKEEASLSVPETTNQHNQRMSWWRNARFGMFIHWGLYAIPAGEWDGETNHAEWILTTAQIPVKEYENFSKKFNPTQFNAEEWVKTAKNAGMKYIVITSKHHDGFCLFDSKFTEYDVMDATPFKRDILKELSEECHKQGIKICFYHSIMDWHHPDYLPRRDWESRSTEGAAFDRYVQYMKGQLKELVTNYGEIGVLWFDGEWENTWDKERGTELYQYVRSLQPSIIINNRVGKGREGMSGTYDPESYVGDFGTPEQEIPDTGLGYDWETCMTMNDHWGYNKHDHNWKSEKELIQNLVDSVSKGGNFLLNVGPTSEGLFPEPCKQRLKSIGKWMEINGESIYGTTSSLFSDLDWGRSTTKSNKIFLHIFEWPENKTLKIPDLKDRAESIYLLQNPEIHLNIQYTETGAIIEIPQEPPDPYVSVIVLEFNKEPAVNKK
jgi:alpha-L-fucosidase